MIKEASLKIFLTSGVTLTVKESEKLDLQYMELTNDLDGLKEYISYCLFKKQPIEFSAEIPHIYQNEKGKEMKQNVKHYYHIPHDKISWFMIERV